MILSMPGHLAAAYTSGAQRARVVTEAWGADNLYCPSCASPKITRLQNNTKAIDFACPSCGGRYQLKGQKTRIGDSITDGAYATMMAALREDRSPNFYFLQYDLATWSVRNLLVVPHFAFPPSAIIARKPLSARAERAGWVGCNLALNRIPAEARIPVVTERTIRPSADVRRQFEYVKPFQSLTVSERGWTLEVLTLLRRHLSQVDGGEFTNEQAYVLVPELEKLFPGNRHVKDKIRQQLQVLRDAGFLKHTGRARWTFTPA